jgi:hypothetical protein
VQEVAHDDLLDWHTAIATTTAVKKLTGKRSADPPVPDASWRAGPDADARPDPVAAVRRSKNAAGKAARRSKKRASGMRFPPRAHAQEF